MPIDLPALVSRWTRRTNRRVQLEETLRAFAWLAITGVIALAIHRLPWALARVHVGWPAWLPTEPTMATIAVALGGVFAAVVLGRAVLRIRRRRIDALTMARRIDAQQGTEDLVATALAVAAGTVAGSAEVQQVVHDKAQATIARVDRPLPRFDAPGRALVGAGVLTAAAIALPFALDELAALTITEAVAAVEDEANAEQEVIPLDEQTKERIDKAIAQLDRYERNPALRREAREQLAAAREHLQRAIDDPQQAAASLSRAEQALRQLAKQARREGLFDQQELSNMSDEQLTESMSQAMDEGQHDTAAAMGRELARRMEEASEPDLRRMAEAFRKRFPPTTSPKPPGRTPESSESGESGEKSGESGEKSGEAGESGESGEAGEKPGEGKRETAEERRERWRKALEEMAEDMERGESGLSSSEMRRLAEELAEEADRGNGSMGRSLDETLSEIHGARRRRLEELRRERGKPGEGEGEGEPGEGKGPGEGKPGEGKGPGMGKPGEGPGMGKPGEGKGPGMGKGEGEGEGKGSGEGEGESGEGKGGEGDGEGPPSGRPGPGGGLGRTPYGMGVLPPGAYAPGERVDVPSGGPPKGAVRIIERVASGPGRDSEEYADIHREYSAVAEGAVRREEIPLTRRDYIRNYFHAVRPQ